MIRKTFNILMGLILFMIITPIVVNAANQKNVIDNANLFDNGLDSYVEELNETLLSKEKFKLGIFTTDKIPTNISTEEYNEFVLNEMNIKNENQSLIFIVSKNEKKASFIVGDNALFFFTVNKNEIFSPYVINYFKDNNYIEGFNSVIDNFYNLLEINKDTVSTISNPKSKYSTFLIVILFIFTTIFITIISLGIMVAPKIIKRIKTIYYKNIISDKYYEHVLLSFCNIDTIVSNYIQEKNIKILEYMTDFYYKKYMIYDLNKETLIYPIDIYINEFSKEDIDKNRFNVKDIVNNINYNSKKDYIITQKKLFAKKYAFDLFEKDMLPYIYKQIDSFITETMEKETIIRKIQKFKKPLLIT